MCSSSLLFAFGLLLLATSTAVQSRGVSPKSEFGLYVTEAIDVPDLNRESYVSCVRQHRLPFWLGLKRSGTLQDSSTYELISIYDSAPGVPHWNFLFVFHLTPGTTPQDYFQRTQSSRNESCEDLGRARIMRIEVLRPTHNSNYPRATSDDNRKAVESNVEYVVEYIAVRSTPEDLTAYREIMSSSLGPAVGRVLIPKGMTFGLTALETASVEYAAEGMPSWNQIHINATLPAHHLTAEERDAAIRHVNSKSGGNAQIAERLEAIRTKPRVDNVKQLYDLAVR